MSLIGIFAAASMKSSIGVLSPRLEAATTYDKSVRLLPFQAPTKHPPAPATKRPRGLAHALVRRRPEAAPEELGYCDEVPERPARAKMAVWLSAFTPDLHGVDGPRRYAGDAQRVGGPRCVRHRGAGPGGAARFDDLPRLMSVAPLKAGRCAAKPPKVILPFDEHWVAVTKPYCASPCAL